MAVKNKTKKIIFLILTTAYSNNKHFNFRKTTKKKIFKNAKFTVILSAINIQLIEHDDKKIIIKNCGKA